MRSFTTSFYVAPVLLTVVLIVAFIARFLMARHVLAPWIMPDELDYSEAAKGLAHNGRYLFRGQPIPLRTIYPALISPGWLVAHMTTTYAVVKTENVVLMTGAGVPLFLWARRLVSPLWALLAVVLFLAIPSFVYTGEIMTENAYLPAVVITLWCISLALERPSLGRQALVLATAAVTASVRLQGLIFALIIPTAIAFKVALDVCAAPPEERGRVVREQARAWWPAMAALVCAAVFYLAYESIHGGPLSSGLGSYSPVSSGHYSARDVVRWAVYHFADLILAVAVLPVSALIVLIGLAIRRTTAPNAAERAFLAATSAAVLWTVVEVAAYASREFGGVPRIEERYLFNLAPALLLALVVWLARGLPRPPGATVVAVLVPAAFLLAYPFETFFGEAVYISSFSVIPLWRLTQRLGNVDDTKLLVALGMLVAGLLFAAVPRRLAVWMIPGAVLVVFVLATNTIFGTVEFLSYQTRHAGDLQGNPSWIDDAVGADQRVELLDTKGVLDPHVLWQAQFWNRSVKRTFGITNQDPIPDVVTQLDNRGHLTPELPQGSPDLHPRFVVTAPDAAVVGTKIASAGELVLWRVRQPLRLRSLIDGVTPDGWTGPTATYTRYVVPRGAKQLVVQMSRIGLPHLPAAHVRAMLGSVKRTVVVPGGGSAVLRLPVRHGPFVLQLAVSPTFSPAQYGSPDTRVLGVRVSFAAA